MSRPNTSWITALLALGTLLAMPGLADDVEYASLVHDIDAETLSPSISFSEFKTTPQPRSLIDAMTYQGEKPQPSVHFDADSDTHVLTRISKARTLSLLTVAETEQARLFLGVNGDGVFGLHFRAIPRRVASRHLEFMRMPYLDNHAQASGPAGRQANPD